MWFTVLQCNTKANEQVKAVKWYWWHWIECVKFIWAHAYVHVAQGHMTTVQLLSGSHMGLCLCRPDCDFSTKNSLKGKRESLPAGEHRRTHQLHTSRHTNPLSGSEACTFHLVQLREQPSIMLAGMWLDVWWSAMFTESNHSPPTHAAVIRNRLQREIHSMDSSKSFPIHSV